ncbi:MAG: hypothetical protein BWY75_00489 [bacterium ADurb.Bin425]|nr:MAG: hypothetical protein BWY75_00489 [bacterium ADurb.Bin425]
MHQFDEAEERRHIVEFVPGIGRIAVFVLGNTAPESQLGSDLFFRQLTALTGFCTLSQFQLEADDLIVLRHLPHLFQVKHGEGLFHCLSGKAIDAAQGLLGNGTGDRLAEAKLGRAKLDDDATTAHHFAGRFGRNRNQTKGQRREQLTHLPARFLVGLHPFDHAIQVIGGEPAFTGEHVDIGQLGTTRQSLNSFSRESTPAHARDIDRPRTMVRLAALGTDDQGRQTVAHALGIRNREEPRQDMDLAFLIVFALGAEAQVVVDALGGAINIAPSHPIIGRLLGIAHKPILPQFVADELEAITAPANEREVATDGVLALQKIVVHGHLGEEGHEGKDEPRHFTEEMPAQPPGQEGKTERNRQGHTLPLHELVDGNLDGHGQNAEHQAVFQTGEAPAQGCGNDGDGNNGVVMTLEVAHAQGESAAYDCECQSRGATVADCPTG